MKKVVFEEERSIVRHHTGGYREYRIPGILPVRDALLLTCEARSGEGDDNLGDWGDIDILVFRLETDGTQTECLRIGESALPKDGSLRTYNNPVLIPDGERTHLIYHRNYETVFITTSEDGGKTWTAPREITEGYREFPFDWNVSATGPGHGVRMANGRLVAPVWLANGETYGPNRMLRKHWPSAAGCVYSDDHGASWHAGALTDCGRNPNETSIASLADGRLLFNFRNQNTDMRRMLGLSSDGGETLERIRTSDALRDPHCFGGSAACTGGVLFANCDSEEARVRVTVKWSRDAGENWETVWEVDPVGGYADVAAVGDAVYVFYERWDKETRCTRELVLAKGRLEDC